jgi:hypothetical protein
MLESSRDLYKLCAIALSTCFRENMLKTAAYIILSLTDLRFYNVSKMYDDINLVILYIATKL